MDNMNATTQQGTEVILTADDLQAAVDSLRLAKSTLIYTYPMAAEGLQITIDKLTTILAGGCEVAVVPF